MEETEKIWPPYRRGRAGSAQSALCRGDASGPTEGWAARMSPTYSARCRCAQEIPRPRHRVVATVEVIIPRDDLAAPYLRPLCGRGRWAEIVAFRRL